MTLHDFYKIGPFIRKGDPKLCERRWNAAIASPDGLARLLLARDAYWRDVVALYSVKRAQGLTEAEIGHYVLHLSTFLGRWEEWAPAPRRLFDERTELLEDEKPEFHAHWCAECTPVHEWLCYEEFCWSGPKAACKLVKA